MKTTAGLAVIVGLLAVGAWAAGGPGYRVPSTAEIKVRDIAVGPDGAGLPPGRGTVSMGEQVYQAKCVACHGPTGTEGPMDKLVGGKLPVKTIGSFWPYATTRGKVIAVLEVRGLDRHYERLAMQPWVLRMR